MGEFAFGFFNESVEFIEVHLQFDELGVLQKEGPARVFLDEFHSERLIADEGDVVVEGRGRSFLGNDRRVLDEAVSYTHLTLPTILLV